MDNHKLQVFNVLMLGTVRIRYVAGVEDTATQYGCCPRFAHVRNRQSILKALDTVRFSVSLLINEPALDRVERLPNPELVLPRVIDCVLQPAFRLLST